jgi:hypothetical protein
VELVLYHLAALTASYGFVL